MALRASKLFAVLAVVQGVFAAPQVSVDTGVPTITTVTSTAQPTASLGADLPAQAALPPTQAWCPSKIFCAGELLQTVNLAVVYGDPKTIVDKPTNFSSAKVLSDFNSILSSDGNNVTNVTEQQIVTFMDNDFRGEGLELEAMGLPNFNPSPPFLNNVTDPLLKAFAQTVHSFWTQLIRSTNSTTLCGEGTNSGSCESTLIPLNHTFVIPGGRFREQYYWDSFWIIQGLIESQLFDIANGTLQNFMDEIEKLGFVPNGGRIYYLNRSQPPLFIHMLASYVQASNDTSILARALPLAEKELQFWHTNRTMNVTSPFTNKTFAVSQYKVTNTAPRPESYLQDYMTANDPTLTTPLNDSQKADLFAELASGAETGWDYSTRFVAQPLAGGSNNTNPALRSFNVRNHIPICLNSILYKSHVFLSQLYSPPFFSSSNATAKALAASHTTAAANLKSAILDLFWDPTKLAFYDFNLTANARNDLFSAAHFYPMWSGIIPDEVVGNETAAFGMFAVVNMVLNKYNGTFPTTFLDSGLQWDAPNAWPPHQYIALEALRSIPSNLSTKPIPAPSSGSTTFSLIPAGQLALTESQLPQQTLRQGGNASSNVDLNALNGTVANGGNATSGETWAMTLQREMANRYFTSALCSWHASGGSIPNILPRLSAAELGVTGSQNNTGNMFEKFSNLDVDSAGQGGEYTVQAGFGWTNGIVLWVASNYGQMLVAPDCPPLIVQNTATNSSGGNSSSSGSSSGALPLVRPSTPGGAMLAAFLLLGTVLATLV